MMNKKNEITFVLNQHLNQLRSRWMAHANEAETYKNLYEEANLFVNRAIQRLPQDHPLHPFNYNALFSDDYARQLATVFEEQDAEPTNDLELDEIVGIDEHPIEDEVEMSDGTLFNISDYNKQVIEDAKTATTGKVLARDAEGNLLTEEELLALDTQRRKDIEREANESIGSD